ncbi:MAG: WYL domain-containing protein [Deltaproteobacteria bacterium]|nr:WYL domain-containing protein [Deltaproteobacteria bacterium]
MTRSDYDRAMFRLTTITTYMNLGRRLKVRDLAEEFGVTKRTIQKDLNQRLAHLPIIRDDRDGSYRFLDGFRLRGTPNAEETTALELMMALIGEIHPHYKDRAGIMVGNRCDRGCFLLRLGFESLDGYLDMVHLLRHAIGLRQSLVFEYTNKHGQAGEYEVDPYRIANFGGYWYLVGLDRKDGKLKTWHLKSVVGIRVSPENYTIDENIEAEISEKYGELHTAWFKDGTRTVDLAVTGAAARYLRRNPGPYLEIIEDDGQNMICRQTYFRKDEVICLVKHWLPDVRVLDEALQGQVDGMLQGYFDNIIK